MTAALHCDNCGKIVTDRNGIGENHQAEGWWVLERNPMIIGPGLSEIERGILDGDDEDDFDLALIIQPPLHFCTMKCLQEWAAKQEDPEEAERG